MKRYAVICAGLALALVPGAVPVTIGVLAGRAIRRAILRRRVRRIVVAASHGRTWDPSTFGEA